MKKSVIKPLFTAMLLAGSLLGSMSAQASAYTITFDAGDPIGGLAAGATLSNQYASIGVLFSPNAYTGDNSPNDGWATNTDMTIVSSTGSDVGGLGAPSLVSGNVLHGIGEWSNEDGDPSILATFTTPISSFSADFASVSAAYASSTGFSAYNGATLLGSVAATTSGQVHLAFSSSTPITSVVMTPGEYNDWVAVDNISFTPVTAVPEPQTWALMAAGLSALLMVQRRSAGKGRR